MAAQEKGVAGVGEGEGGGVDVVEAVGGSVGDTEGVGVSDGVTDEDGVAVGDGVGEADGERDAVAGVRRNTETPSATARLPLESTAMERPRDPVSAGRDVDAYETTTMVDTAPEGRMRRSPLKSQTKRLSLPSIAIP